MYHLLRTPDGQTLEVKDAGPEGGRPLLLFHGLAAAASSFPNDHLPETGRRLIVLNRPGTGASTPRSYSIGQIALLAAWVLDRLNIDRCDVGGWDAGAVFALAFAQAFPNRTNALLLLAPALPPGDPAALPLLPAPWKGVRRMLPALRQWQVHRSARALAKDPDAVLRAAVADMPEADQRIALALEWRDLLLHSRTEGYAHSGAGVLADTAALLRAAINWRSIGAPVHIWSGGADTTWPPATAAWLAAQLPAAQLHTLPAAGHLLHLAHWPDILEHFSS